MNEALFCDPGEYLTPESILAEYFNRMEDFSLLMGCPRCTSLNVKSLEIERRRLTLCHDCGELSEAPDLN
ncbi:MAG TPA: hypothetical protein VEI97_12960 [bacterium]|nr:hypothetical protein [bacterium]